MAGSVDGYLKQLTDQGQQMLDNQRVQRDQLVRETERLRGIKTGFRMPKLRATGAPGFTMGGPTAATPQKPAEGYAWAIRHLVITGMTRGATPDVIQICRESANDVIWELNGNQYAQTWGRGELWLRPGESLFYVAVGTFASTSPIVASGAVDEFPAEAAAKAVD